MHAKLVAATATACLAMLVCAVPPASADAAAPATPKDSLPAWVSASTDGPSAYAEYLAAHQHAAHPRATEAHRAADAVTTAVPCGANAGAALQAAVAAAGPGDTLTLAPRCTYSITTPDTASSDSALYLDKALTIVGRGATIERASGATSDFRVFRIDNSGSLTLSNATVRGGRAGIGTTDGNGGGFELNGSGSALTLTGVRVAGNVAYTGGGGIANYGGTLKVTGGLLTGNSAGNGGGGLEQGAGSATFRSSSIANNTADAALFGYFAAGGGGIRMIGNGTASLTYTPVTGNQSLHSLTFGGAIENIYGTVNLNRSPVQRNAANGDSARGGAVSNLGTFSASDSPFVHNTAAGTSSGGLGGALSENGGPATLTRSPVTNNTASGPGAAGGGIYDDYGPVTLVGSPVRSNTPDNCSPAGSVAGCTG